jgi:DNA-binding XRE family transcriptional regulator
MDKSETERLIEELRAYCAKRGEQSAIAREIGVSRQRMSDFVRGRKHPSLEQGLALLRIMRRLK